MHTCMRLIARVFLSFAMLSYMFASVCSLCMQDVLLRCLSPDMNDRPDSAEELLHALECVFDREEAAMEA